MGLNREYRERGTVIAECDFMIESSPFAPLCGVHAPPLELSAREGDPIRSGSIAPSRLKPRFFRSSIPPSSMPRKAPTRELDAAHDG